MTENGAEFGKIIAKAWRDTAFMAHLIANPAVVSAYTGSQASQSLAASLQ